MKIQTVLGEIDETKLGRVLIHEHIACVDSALRENFGSYIYDQKILEDVAVRLIKQAKALGIDTIVDATPINLGRNIELMQNIAKRTNVNIIASSGFYYQTEVYLEYDSVEMIVAMMEKEILEGIAKTGVKPGILKIACSRMGVNEIIKKSYLAMGTIAAKYNIPIFCHHEPDIKNGLEILDILKEVNVPSHLIIMGHAGDTNDLDYLRALLARGCYIGMDRFAFCEVSNSLENRVDTIVKLVKEGYINQLLLSHDFGVYFGIQETFEQFIQHKDIDPKISYKYISETVVPQLLEKGLNTKDIDQLLIENPKRILCSKTF